IPVVRNAPGLFSANSSGTGQGAILNGDFSVNGSSNAAAKGSAVILFGTGEGSTSPRVEDGSVTAPPLPRPTSTVTATAGGVAAEVLYAGAAPGFVAGVLQVNLVIPPSVPSGNQPVVVKIGDASTQAGLTVAVR